MIDMKQNKIESKILTREELREEVRNILVGTLLDTSNEKVSNDLLDTVIKYYYQRNKISQEEGGFLEESYLELIKKEKEKLSKEINLDNITTIVSAFSFSNANNLIEEYTFEKDLRVFQNVEKIYLLYTKEIKYSFEKYVKEYKKIYEEKFKNSNIKIIGIEVDGRDVDEPYKKLKKLVLKNEINKDNTILDITLGMKTISIAFYKISSERQIKSINWNEKFLSSYNVIDDNTFKENKGGKQPRIALSAKLNLMKEPIKEALGIYSKINENILRGNYEIVSDFYKINGIDDMAFFYRCLNDIFNIENMMQLDSEKFYDNLNEKIYEILNYKYYSMDNIQRLKEIVIYLLNLIYYVTDKNYKLKINNIFGITKKDLSENTDDFDKEKYYIYLKCKYANLGDKIYYYYTDITDDNNSKEELYDYIFDKKEKNELIDIKEIYEIIFEEEFKHYDDDENFKIFEMEEKLLENIEYKLQFKNGILEIPNANFEKFVLKIDFSKEEKLKKIIETHNKYGFKDIPMKYKPILILLENLKSKKNEVNLDEIVGEDANDMAYTRILKIIKDVNEVIAKRLNENGIKLDIDKFEFIEYKKIRLKEENKNKFWKKIIRIENSKILNLS